MADIELIAVDHLNWPNSVISAALSTPPGSPTLGDRYIVASSPTGAWSGHATHIARWDGAAWTYRSPTNGTLVYNEATSAYLKFDGSNWVAFSGSVSLQTAYAGGNTVSLTTGTDIDIANSSDHLLQVGSTAVLKSKDQATPGAAGNAVNITGGQGGAAAPAGIPGTGGVVTIQAGTKGSEAASAGGTIGGVGSNNLNLYGGSAGDSSGSKAGNVVIEGGQVGTGAAGGTPVPGDVKIGQDPNKTHTVRIGQATTGTPVEVKGPLWTPLVTLTDAATVTVTTGKGNAFIVTLGGNRTLDISFPTSYSNSAVSPNGHSGTIIVKQDGTGSRTLAFASTFKTSGDVSLNSAANAYTVFRFDVESNTVVHLRKVEASSASGTITGVTAGTALTGGGTSGTVTLNVAFGTSSSTACVGNDSRLSDARAPTGSAGGSLGSTYPNPTVTKINETSGPTALTIGTIADGEFLKRSGTTLISAASVASTTVKKAGTTIGTRGAINLIEGSNITLTVADNSGSDRVDITVTGTTAGGGGPTLTSYTLSSNAATLDVGANNDFEPTNTMGGNTTLTLSNGTDGNQGIIYVKQDGTGGRTLTFTVASRTILRDANSADDNPESGPNTLTGYSYHYFTAVSTAYIRITKIFLG